jgi:DNA-binding MarR family transcriptional regulator
MSMRSTTRRDRSAAIGRLFDETVLLYLRLSALAARLYGKGPLSGPRRTVLATLARTGPQTVAQMARLRAQPRQRFQPLVNALLEEGLVEALANPAHRQSPLIALTPRGRRMVRDIHRVEQRGRQRLKTRSTTTQIANSADVVRDLRLAVDRELAE